MSNNGKWMVVIVIAGVVGGLMGPVVFREVPLDIMLPISLLFFGCLIAFILYSLSGNQGGGAAGGEAQAEARRLRPVPGKGRIYIVRKGFVGALQGMDIAIEGVASGQIKSNRFLVAEVEPGDYRIAAKMARGGKSTASTYDIGIGAGEVAVIHVILEMGTLANATVFERLDDATAREKLAGSKMMLWTEGQGAV